jgi:hypothetical protein
MSVPRDEAHPMNGARPILLAVLVLFGCFIAGGLLMAFDHVVIGILVAAAGIPGALVAWMAAD